MQAPVVNLKQLELAVQWLQEKSARTNESSVLSPYVLQLFMDGLKNTMSNRANPAEAVSRTTTAFDKKSVDSLFYFGNYLYLKKDHHRPCNPEYIAVVEDDFTLIPRLVNIAENGRRQPNRGDMLSYYLFRAEVHPEQEKPRPPTQITSSRPVMYLVVDGAGNVLVSGAYLGPQKDLQDHGKCTAFGRAVPYKQHAGDNKIREVHADFALNLLRRCPDAEPVVSPANAGLLLGQCACIAYGKTRDEILRLILNGTDPMELHSFYGSLIRYLKLHGRTDCKLNIAHMVFAKDSVRLSERTLGELETFYDGQYEKRDFGDTDAVARDVNAFVSQVTIGRITYVLGASDIDDEVRLLLVGAMYFKGKWLEQFRTCDTRADDFFVNGFTKVQKDMMNKRDRFLFAENSEYKALIMPYEGKKFFMLFLLPITKTGLPALLKTLTGKVLLHNIKEEMNSWDVIVKIPKFKVEVEIEIVPMLKDMN